jgi:hypothetical protein
VLDGSFEIAGKAPSSYGFFLTDKTESTDHNAANVNLRRK